MSVSKISSTTLLNEGGLLKGGKEDGKEKAPERPNRSASPEIAKCAICLGDVVNRSYSNSCAHQFCFGCLLEWSKIKPECPLCKSSFRSIYHNFRSNDEYDEYVVPTPVPHLSIRFTATSGNYRLSPFIRVLEARAGHHHQHSPLGHAFEGVSIPAGMFPPPPPVVLSSNPFNNGSSSMRPEFFGDLISEHRRVQEEAVQMPGYQNRRRRYDRNEWVQPFGSTLQPGSVIFPSVDYIRSHPSVTNRLRNWLYRELNVLLGLHRSRDQMAFVYDLIMHLINHYDVRSRDFRDMVNTYFGTKTAHFQHELYHFILSGMSMEEYDRVAEYPNSSSSNGRSARRNTAPEIITLEDSEEDDDDENSANRSSRPVLTQDNDVILVLSSDDEEDSGRRNPCPSRTTQSSRGYASASASTFNNSRSNQDSAAFIRELINMPELDLSVGSNNNRERSDDREGARRPLRSGRDHDPDMPVLEPQVYPYVSVESFCFGGTTIDHSRATAATTTVTTANSGRTTGLLSSETVDQNLTRPSVLSSSSGTLQSTSNNNNDVDRFEPDFDIDVDVSVESYSSPPRQDSRPLTSPDFPILQLRRNMLDRNTWERSSRVSGSCPFAAVSNSGPSSRGSNNTSAFVPYEPENSHGIREEPVRPPRPSCIHASSAIRANHNLASGSSSREYRSISPAPAFRIDLYPRGISSSQVMDLSRSAGLISNASVGRSAKSPPQQPPTVTIRSETPPPQHSSTLPVIAGSSKSPVASTSQSAFAASKLESKTDTERNNEGNDSDELECLGSFPIQKKPPLAVITLSSDDEEESRVKSENKRERLNILPSDEDTNLLDGFMTWASHPLPSDFNLLDVPSSPPIIDFHSSSSSSSFLPVMAPQQTSSASGSGGSRTSGSAGSSAVISIPTIPKFRLSIRNSSAQSLSAAAANSQTRSPPASTSGASTERHRKKYKHSTPKKSKKRVRVFSGSDDSSDNDESPPSVQPTLSSPAKVPKKRKYIEFHESPPKNNSFGTSESSEVSEVSTDSEDDESGDVYEIVRTKSKSSPSKRRSTSKRKHKSKGKKSKKSKKSKDKEKEKTRKSRKRGESRATTSNSDPTISPTVGASNACVGPGTSTRQVKPKKGTTQSSSTAKPTVQAPTSSSASFSLSSSTRVMNMSICDFEYPSGLLDLSFNSRTDDDDDTPMMPQVDDDSTVDLRIQAPASTVEPAPVASTVDTTGLFGSSSPRLFNAFWDDYSMSSTAAERRGGWID